MKNDGKRKKKMNAELAKTEENGNGMETEKKENDDLNQSIKEKARKRVGGKSYGKERKK